MLENMASNFKLVQNHGIIHGYDSWYGSGVSIGAGLEAMQHACGRKLCICILGNIEMGNVRNEKST